MISNRTTNHHTELIEIGKLGKTRGFNGEFTFFPLSDFLSFFQPQLKVFTANKEQTLTIAYFKSISTKYYIKFDEISSKEQAQSYVNAIIHSTKEETKALCNLQQDEFFYFDIVGCEIIEDSAILGVVVDIERIGNIDYFIIQAQKRSQKSPQKNPHMNHAKQKTFLIPYINQYIQKVDIENKQILSQNAKYILEQS